MSNQVKGTVKTVMNTETFQGGSSKRTLVIDYKNGQYDDSLALDFWKDKAEPLATLSVGDEVEVKYSVNSREYNGKWYTNANGYACTKVGGSSGGIKPNESFTGNPKDIDTSNFGAPESDDLPF